MPRRANAKAGQAPPQTHSGLLEGFSQHRRYNSTICRDLMRDTGTRDIGQKIGNCSLAIKAQVLMHPDLPPDVNLKAARVCNARLCPFCEWRRSRVWKARLHDGLTALYADKPKLRGIFVTLTQRDCRLEELGDTLKEMNKSWTRFSRR